MINPLARIKNRALTVYMRARGKARGKRVADGDVTSSPVLTHSYTTIEGKDASLADLRGKAVLLVNTASQCGYTAQYEGLEALWRQYRDRGLVVIGFPCDDFGHQEPGSEAEIAESCKVRFGVTFPLSSKLHAKGPHQSPIYRTLTEETPAPLRGEIRWNFTKFLLDAEGRPVARFDPAVDPSSKEIREAIESVLPA